MNVRQRNLTALVKAYPSHREAASAFGMTPANLSKLINGHSEMRPQTARKIERALKLEEGWMDVDRINYRDEWVMTYNSSLAGGKTSDEACAAADHMLELVRSRFEI